MISRVSLGDRRARGVVRDGVTSSGRRGAVPGGRIDGVDVTLSGLAGVVAVESCAGTRLLFAGVAIPSRAGADVASFSF